ncbi:HNH endonuclease [Streptomyces sp. NPDC003480]
MATLSGQISAEEQSSRQALADSLWDHTTVRRRVYTPLRAALWAMAHGIDACMYCGRDMADTIDHYVPVSKDPLKTFCWFNHILACSTCNSRYKRDVHLEDAFGNPKLIDPTREDPFEHLHLNLDTGLYLSKTERGDYTCRTCGLNEHQLPEARLRAMRQIQLHLDGWRQSYDAGDHSKLAAYTSAIREQPFADVCQAMLRQAQLPEAQTLFTACPGILPLLRRTDIRTALLVSHSQDAELPAPHRVSVRPLTVPAARPLEGHT